MDNKLDTTAIIIVSYKTPWFLNQCLKSVFKHTDINTFKIFISQNTKDQDSINVINRYIKKYPNNISLKINDKNLGYVGGVNEVYSNAIKYDRVCFLNSDCIVTPDWLVEMNKVLNERDDVVQVAPDSNQFYSESFFWRIIRWQFMKRFPKFGARIYRYMLYFNPPRHLGNKDFSDTGDKFYLFCGGFCNLIRTKYFKELGYFLDPNIVHGYGDDFDLSYYLRQFGNIGATYHSYVFHFVNASLNKLGSREQLKQRVSVLNRLYIVSKWEDRIKKDMNNLNSDELLSLSNSQEIDIILKYFGLINTNPKFREYIKSIPAKEYEDKLLN